LDIGFFSVQLSGFTKSEQAYLRNSAILTTTLFDDRGSILEIQDFIPKFESFGRDFRPNMLIRILSPLKGHPRAQIKLRPTYGYGWGTPEKTRGSNHIRYLLSNSTVRLTTNAPISYIIDEVCFEIDEPVFLILMPDESLKQPVNEIGISFRDQTLTYWRKWIRTLTIPFEWQDLVLRACITLKLHCFEETGGLVKALTTSIPYSPKGGAYDFRYCWLRDSTGMVDALNQLGATDIMESFLRFLFNVVAAFSDSRSSTKYIQPVFGISLETRLPERELHRLSGYRGLGPVRLGHADSESVQNDVYGSILLSCAHLFFDRRVAQMGDQQLFKRLEEVGYKAFSVYDKVDLSPRRGIPAVHTRSAVLCWAAVDRLAEIAKHLDLTDRFHLCGKKQMKCTASLEIVPGTLKFPVLSLLGIVKM